MLSTYRRVLSLPGALVFSMSGLVARLPISMISLGIVLLVSSRTGSYGLAGAVSAAFLIATAALSVPQARLIDRLGQRTVLAPAVTVFVLGLAGVMVAVEAGVITPWAHISAAVAGAALPQIDACVRARWSYLIKDKGELLTAFAFESVVDEVVFILGPTLVTVLVTVVHPLAGLTTAAVAAAAGTAVFVSQRRTEPPPSGRAGARRTGSMHWEMLGPLAVCGFGMGVLLGGAEVATVAFSEEQGTQALAGLMLALWALGSLLAGVVTGAVPISLSNATRFRWGLLALAVLMVPLPFVGNFVLLAVFLFLAGFAISPTLIASFAWIQETVPAGRLTEGMTLFITGLGAGLAPGAAIVGRVVDASGASASFWVSVAAGFCGAALAFAVARLSGARPSPTGSSG
jgi:predicted MFS family arabinose efflux permease